MTRIHRVRPLTIVDALAGNGIQFVENASNDFDYGRHTTIPDGFGDGEFTLEIVIEPYQVSTVGQTATGAGIRENWANESAEPGDSADWWFYGNFLLDGHNNSDTSEGTFSIQIYNSGVVRWSFGDGATGMPTGDLWGVQNSSGVNVLDGERHVIACIRRWSDSPANSADLELWVDGVLQDTVNTGSRTNMATSYWDSWTGFPVAQQGWLWGAEENAVGGSDWADFKGIIRSIAFFDGAKASNELQGVTEAVNTGHADYVDHFPFDEGTGNPQTAQASITMTLGNAQSGGFWP